MDCNTAMHIYNSELSRILDAHAPVIEFSVNPNQSKWVNTQVQEAKRMRRKAERVHNRLLTEESKEAFRKAAKHAEAVINTTRDEYYQKRLKACDGNKKETFSIVNQLMDRDLKNGMIPTNKPTYVICEEMQEFFEK